MYQHIGVPVHLAHVESLGKAINTAADLATLYHSQLTLVAVTGPAPSEVAHNVDEFTAKLESWAAQQSAELGVKIETRVSVCNDPSADLDHVLDREFHELGVDLVVVASHIPGYREYIFHSNAGFLASHTDLSVLVVRG